MQNKSDVKRLYKETPKEAGIFLITNVTNGKVLLGSSLNLHGPLNKHRFMLSTRSHWNSGLQQDFIRFGADAFKFEIVELIKPRDDADFNIEAELSKIEAKWLEKLQPVGEQGYNLNARIRE